MEATCSSETSVNLFYGCAWFQSQPWTQDTLTSGFPSLSRQMLNGCLIYATVSSLIRLTSAMKAQRKLTRTEEAEFIFLFLECRWKDKNILNLIVVSSPRTHVLIVSLFKTRTMDELRVVTWAGILATRSPCVTRRFTVAVDPFTSITLAADAWKWLPGGWLCVRIPCPDRNALAGHTNSSAMKLHVRFRLAYIKRSLCSSYTNRN